MTALAEALGCPEPGPVVVGEVGQAHDGSLGTAHAYVDAIARAGAHAVKFQTHIARAESTPDEPWRVPFSPQDESRYDYWRRMEFTAEQWRGLRDHARDAGLAFLSSPFSLEAVELLASLEADGLKIASGEVGHLALIEACARTGRPVLLSTGMSDWFEIDAAVDRLRLVDSVPFAVLQCASSYPAPFEEVGLDVLDVLRDRYQCPVGLSDHSGTIFPALASAALGADIIEVHVTLSREAFGPDVTSSLTTDELATVVEGCGAITTMLSHPVDKDAAASGRSDLRRLFTRSLVARRDLPAGHVVTADDLVAKKPSGGFPPGALDEIVGRRLTRPVVADQRLAAEDLA